MLSKRYESTKVDRRDLKARQWDTAMHGLLYLFVKSQLKGLWVDVDKL